MTIDIKNIDGLVLLSEIQNNTVDLILTDPPYIISKETGMNTLNEKIKQNKVKRTEAEWETYKNENNLIDESCKLNYINYGSTYGSKYSIQTDYGDWDKNFTIELLEEFLREYYRVLKIGGTIIIFFDIWKITILKELLVKYNFKQIRLIEWIKTNTVPINSKINYLSNAREIALVAVKKNKKTFNSIYDKGIYNFPIQSGKNRFHPTQKNLKLFEELIKVHSNEGDLILDTFLGSGTTALACRSLGRNFVGCEINLEYFTKLLSFFV